MEGVTEMFTARAWVVLRRRRTIVKSYEEKSSNK
jgi:hypothetical protein